jgi:hypothetical protein
MPYTVSAIPGAPELIAGRLSFEAYTVILVGVGEGEDGVGEGEGVDVVPPPPPPHVTPVTVRASATIVRVHMDASGVATCQFPAYPLVSVISNGMS